MYACSGLKDSPKTPRRRKKLMKVNLGQILMGSPDPGAGYLMGS